MLTERVFDSATGKILLIPQGARLIGCYDSVVAFGQRRALAVRQRTSFGRKLTAPARTVRALGDPPWRRRRGSSRPGRRRPTPYSLDGVRPNAVASSTRNDAEPWRPSTAFHGNPSSAGIRVQSALRRLGQRSANQIVSTSRARHHRSPHLCGGSFSPVSIQDRISVMASGRVIMKSELHSRSDEGCPT